MTRDDGSGQPPDGTRAATISDAMRREFAFQFTPGDSDVTQATYVQMLPNHPAFLQRHYMDTMIRVMEECGADGVDTRVLTTEVVNLEDGTITECFYWCAEAWCETTYITLHAFPTRIEFDVHTHDGSASDTLLLDPNLPFEVPVPAGLRG